MYEIKNLSKIYGNKTILNKISYEFNEGNIYVIRGINGSGKSTLFKILSGVIHKSSGYITVNKTISYLPDKYILPSLIKTKTYLNFIFNDYKFVNGIINKYNIENKLIFSLSKGNKQKIGIISKTYVDKDVYLYDEGIDGLDESTKKLFFNKLKELKKSGKIIILSLHEDIKSMNLNEIKLRIDNGILYEE